MNDPMLLIEEIRTSPTVETWERILRPTIEGEREFSKYITLHYATAEDMVLTAIENSRHKSLANGYFHQALECVLTGWTPAASNDEGREATLRLLQTFQPEVGRTILQTDVTNAGPIAGLLRQSSKPSYLNQLARNTFLSYGLSF